MKITKKTTRYLVALGCVEYFSIVLGFIPSIIYGYNAAMAQYQEVEYSSWLSVYMVYIPLITLVIMGSRIKTTDAPVVFTARGEVLLNF